jgi:hypothetical protein
MAISNLKKPLFFAVWCMVLLGGDCFANAATLLFDFEIDADLQGMRDEGKTALGLETTLERAERFATSGRFALKFSTPGWREGKPQWPSFDCRPPVADWTGFDRLAFDITSVSEQPQGLSLFISDSKIPTRRGLHYTVRLAPLSYTPIVIPLAQLAEKQINPADIRVIHIFTTEPSGDMTVYVDRLMLLKPGEAIPALPASFLKDFAALQAESLVKLRAEMKAWRARVAQETRGVPKLKNWGERACENLEARANALKAALAEAKTPVLEATSQIVALRVEMERLEPMARFRKDFETVRPKVQSTAKVRDDIAVGFASSMEKVLPRGGLAITAKTTNAVEVSLARNEKESFQLLVLPCEHDLSRVRIHIGDLRSESGTVFSATNINAAPVGYVQTKAAPPSGSPHVGWWPDPILDFQTTADIAKNDLQSFWIRVRAPRQQAPGHYRGKMELIVEGAPVFSFDLGVRVFSFMLPDRSPLPLAITFAPGDNPLTETTAEQRRWRQSPDYPVNAWKKHKQLWADFLADYYITYDNLYHHGIPDYEILTRLRDQGRLDWFNLGYFAQAGTNAAQVEAWKTANLPRFREAYAKAKDLGLLPHAYIYGCDENKPELFSQVESAARILKAEFPGVLIMTTADDQSYGMESLIKSVDAFCPLTPSFDPEKAARARAAGKQVWWYICCAPHHPSANMFVEYPAIEGRLLMGAMSAKYRPDGFLYYQISIWNSQKPIASGPFTDWDPRSWTTYHGDGSWTCVGPDGIPLPTIRLENFRDGLEDFAYVCLLESAIARIEASPALRAARTTWLERARPLLQAPADVLKSKTDYTHDPATLYHWRNAMAEAIMEANTEPAKNVK